MFNKNYRPLLNVIDYSHCEYNHVAYRFRQKIRAIQSWLLSIRSLSKCDYKMVMFDDGCILIDPLRNKILWHFDYYSSVGIVLGRLEQLYRFYQYEKNNNYTKILISRNDYIALKHKYYGC